MLAALGLGELEQRIYLELLAGHGGSSAELAGRLGAGTRQAVEALHRHGLVRMDGDLVRPAPPDLALDSLLLDRMRELTEARLTVREWVQRQQAGEPAPRGV